MTASSAARRLALIGVLALLVSLLPVASAFANHNGSPDVLDLSGDSNVATSLSWSFVAYPDDAIAGGDGPTEVLIGRDDLFADNLASGVLQGADGDAAPLLLTNGDSLSAETLAELERLDTNDTVVTVSILGGTDAVSQSVQDDIEAAGFTTQRLAGETRIETAVDVAQEVDSDTVIIARGFAATDPTQAFADSLAAGGWAAAEGWPVLLTQTEVLTGSTAAQLQNGGYTSAKVVGGTAAISDDTLAQIQAIIPDTQRVSGPTRDETAVAIANERGFNSADDAPVILVDGFQTDSWADGFAAAAVSGTQDYPIVLSNGDNLPPATATFVGASSSFANHFDGVVGICGTTVSDSACEALADALGATVEPFGPQPGGGLTDGSITLDAASAAAGGQVTGSVADPGTVQTVSVTGCGFNNDNVTVDGDGDFTLTIPANQAPGSCSLQFNILRTGGATEQANINFTVTAGPASTTDAPDLLSASLNASTNVVTYTFDATIASTAAVGFFKAYLQDGTPLVPTTVQVSGMTVLAQFANTVDPATVAAIADSAVQDSNGRFSYASSVPLTGTTSAPGVTQDPDLQTVNNFRVDMSLIVGDFRFDEPVLAGPGPAFADIDPTKFFIVASDSVVYPGMTVTAVSADSRTVTVSFAGTTMVPTASIVRGGVQSDAVEEVGDPMMPNVPDAAIPLAGAGNVLQTEPRTGNPAVVGTADRTDDPDLTGVAVAGANTVAFTFDEPVNTPAAMATAFRIYSATGVESMSTAATRTGTNTFNVTFPAGTVGNAVGASIPMGVVTAVDDNTPNAPHELPLQQVLSTAGRTSLPDLVSVTIEVDAFGQNKVVYRFDSALPGVYTAPAADFALVDTQGTLFSPAGAGTINTDRTEVTFSIQGTMTNGYTNAQAAAAVIGVVEDQAAPPPPAAPVFTEGDVAVTR